MPPAESDHSETTMNNLLEDLLREILLRLPDCFSVAQCRAVSKRWNSLLSSPQFVSDFVNHCHRLRSPVLSHTCYRSSSTRDHVASSPTQPFFHFLPGEVVEIIASCNDLMLAMTDLFLFVCNPFTKQWCRIPDPPPKRSGSPRMWLACHPDRIRYKVVLVHLISSGSPSLSVMIYSSDTGMWRHGTVVFPRPLSPMNTFDCGDGAAGEDGTLYWLDGITTEVPGLAAFNPFDDVGPKGELQGRFISMPVVDGTVGRFCLGMCQGRPRVATLDVCHGTALLRIAELGDDATSCYIRHETRFENLVGTITALSIHPTNGNAVRLHCQNEVLIFNFEEQSEEVKIHVAADNQPISAFSLVCCPYWPTLLRSRPTYKSALLNVVPKIIPKTV